MYVRMRVHVRTYACTCTQGVSIDEAYLEFPALLSLASLGEDTCTGRRGDRSELGSANGSGPVVPLDIVALVEIMRNEIFVKCGTRASLSLSLSLSPSLSLSLSHTHTHTLSHTFSSFLSLSLSLSPPVHVSEFVPLSFFILACVRASCSDLLRCLCQAAPPAPESAPACLRLDSPPAPPNPMAATCSRSDSCGYTYAHLRTHVHTRTHTHTHTHTHIRTCTHTHTHHTLAHTHIRSCTRTHTHKYTHTYTYMHTFIHHTYRLHIT